MRVLYLIIADIKFQWKYGFYFIYFILSLLYLFLLLSIPPQWIEMIRVLLIFTDPAALGLFMMGAIVLLEKSQRVHNALAISPITVSEYVLSKIISIAFISTLVAMFLGIGSEASHLFNIFLSTILTSTIFTLLALLIAIRITSLNQFILYVIPIEFICLTPAFLYFFKIGPSFLQFFPISSCLGIMGNLDINVYIAYMIIALSIGILFKLACLSTQQMWNRIGGGKR